MNRLLLLAGVLCACGDPRPVAIGNAGASQDATCPSAVQPTFSSIDQKVLKPLCTGCHQPAFASTSGDLDLSGDGYAALVGVLAKNTAATSPPPGLLRVKAGDPDQSLLWLKLVTKSFNDPRYGSGMPQDRPGSLCQAVTDTVRAWIQGGAPHD
jgi:hypothetical protein